LLHHAKSDLGILEVVSHPGSGCRLCLLAREPRSIHAGIESIAQGSGLLKLTIVVNAVSSKSGGAATYLQNLIVALANSQHRYVVFVPEAKRRPVSGAANVMLVATSIGHKPWWSRLFWDQVTLRRIVKTQRADVLLSSSDFGMLWPPCKQILLIRNPLFFSQLYADHIWPHKSWTFKLEFLLRRWLVNLSAKSSDLVMTASHSMRNDARKVLSIPETKIAVNYFGVPSQRFPSLTAVSPPPGGAGNHPFKMLFVSEYSDYKNL